MDIAPGQWWQKLLAVIFVVAAIWLTLQRGNPGIPPSALWGAGILAFMFVVLSIPPVYGKWMAFAAWLSVWSTRVLFSVVYLVVVPFVWLGFAASRRKKGQGHAGQTFWVAKRRHDRSVDELSRMG